MPGGAESGAAAAAVGLGVTGERQAGQVPVCGRAALADPVGYGGGRRAAGGREHGQDRGQLAGRDVDVGVGGEELAAPFGQQGGRVLAHLVGDAGQLGGLGGQVTGGGDLGGDRGGFVGVLGQAEGRQRAGIVVVGQV